MQGRVRVADDGDLAALVERPVAHGAVVNALPHEVFALLSGFQVPVLHARGDDHALRLILVVFGAHDKVAFRPLFDARRLLDLHFRAEVGDLFEQIVRERLAADGFDGGEVFQARRSRYLPAQAVSL